MFCVFHTSTKSLSSRLRVLLEVLNSQSGSFSNQIHANQLTSLQRLKIANFNMDESATKNTKHVVIVGSGVAGLACGVKLSSVPGLNVTLLEAADTIGGRVKSAEFGEGGQVELGAQWVHGENGNSIYSLAAPYDLLEDDHVSDKFGLSSMYVTQKGEFLPDSVSDRVDELLDKLRVTATSALGIKDNEPLGHFTERIFWKANEEAPIHTQEAVCAGVLDWIHRFQNHIDGAESWFVTSCRGQLQYASCEGNPTISWKKPASYNTLLQLLINGRPKGLNRIDELPTWIHLRKEVKSITYVGDDEVIVQCKDGKKYNADYVVCTVSLGVLKTKHGKLFSPPLPLEKVNAIEHLGFGVVDKVFLEFFTSWWPEKSLGFNFIWDDCCKVHQHWVPGVAPSALLQEDENGIPHWCRSLLGFYTLKNQPKTLVTWVTGPAAECMEMLDTETLQKHLVKVLQKFVGAVFTVPPPVALLRSTWKTNPLTRGSYSFRTVSTEQHEVSAAELAAPILTPTKKPVICFAGEATHYCFYSTVHGAYDSGVREAERIIGHLHKDSSGPGSAKDEKSEKDEQTDYSFDACCSSLLNYV